MKKLLLLVILLVSVNVFGQGYFPINDDVFREGMKINPPRTFGEDTILGLAVIADSSAGIMIRTLSDTTMMYQKEDTARLFTTAAAWKFTPPISSCCNGRANEILFYDSNGVVASDTSFKFFSSAPFKTLYLDANDGQVFLRTRVGNSIGSSFVMSAGAAILSNTFNTSNISRLSLDSTYTDLTYINNARQQSIIIDTNGVVFQNTSGIPYLFPKFSGDIGQVLTVTNTVVNGSHQLVWSNQTLSGSATLDFGSIGAHAYEDLNITVNGAVDGDVVSLGAPNGSVPADASFFAWVSATDTVTVRCFNIDGGSIDPASGTFKVKIFK